MKYNTFIFDLDGTLLDTLQDLANSVNYALSQHGMPTHSIDDVRRFVGNGVRVLMERAIPEGAANPAFDATFATFRQHYMQHSLDTTRPYDGIPELIHELKARGCHMAVVSNKMMAATQELVRHFFPEIEVAIGEHEAAGIRKKPAPDTVFEALRQLGVPHTSSLTPLTSHLLPLLSMWATATSTWRRHAIAVCRVSACCGAFATNPFYWNTGLRPS